MNRRGRMGTLIARIGNAKARHQRKGERMRVVVLSEEDAQLLGCTHVHGLEICICTEFKPGQATFLTSKPTPEELAEQGEG